MIFFRLIGNVVVDSGSACGNRFLHEKLKILEIIFRRIFQNVDKQLKMFFFT